ncbi:hypothetical protein [Bacillus sp. es.034]|uniref:hypothetical protein n=1 Tax=Bacillus sp. es.034 TaxID=1761763 RepID=UPI000BF9A7D6|nr:hypothetical protein [Bacillus sp. es.034]PFG04475.1 hypothetical protein ATG71_1220 [Bacillus sp. es.034]
MIERVEKVVHGLLIKHPLIRRAVKRTYHLGMYIISPKIKYEGELKRVSPNDDYEYFFGYYDKSPWDKSDRFMLCLRVKNSHSSVAPDEKAEIILIDTKDNNSFRKIAETNAWNVQQGCMLQWLGPDHSRKVLYNDYRNGNYCTVILDIYSDEEQVINMPVYSVSEAGDFALSLDFSRLHSMRPGYGYSNKENSTKGQKCPDTACIWKINLKDGDITPLLKYTDFANFEPRKEMENAEHKVNHIMINPSGTRFMVLHRWYLNNIKYSRLVTCNSDGSGLYNLSDDNFVSHCNWKSDKEILAFLNKNESGNGYYLMKDETQEWEHMWQELTLDGHPSYSPNGESVVTDTYPNRQRLSSLYLIKGNKVKRISRVFSPFKYDNDVRCDLHPRWNRKGDMISIDSVYEGKRGLYIISVKGDANSAKV